MVPLPYSNDSIAATIFSVHVRESVAVRTAELAVTSTRPEETG
jgi:hypothetical protein